MTPKMFYRFESQDYSDGSYPNPKIQTIRFFAVKETPKGYWIARSDYGRRRWVSSTSKKRYAYPTKEEALNNFLKRTERRLSILKYQVSLCKAIIEEVKIFKV